MKQGFGTLHALVLWGTFARTTWAPDYPDGVDPQEGERFCDQIEESWGHGRVWPLISDLRGELTSHRHRA